MLFTLRFKSIAIVTALLFIAPTAHAKARVFLLGGQSNMVGQGTNAELTPPYDSPQNDVNFWNRSTNDWTPLRPGFGNNANSFGPEVSFGHAIKNAFPDDDLYLVKYAANGTALYNDWAPAAPGGPQYNAFTNTVAAALANLNAAGIDYEVAGMLWMQGESDAVENQGQNYETNLRNFIAAIRNDYNEPDLPFILGRVLTFYGSAAQTTLVRDAQVTVANTTPNVEWFDTDAYAVVSPSNAGHYGTQGILDMGNDFAAGYQRIIPEPATMSLLLLIAGVILARRKRA